MGWGDELKRSQGKQNNNIPMQNEYYLPQCQDLTPFFVFINLYLVLEKTLSCECG